MPQPCAALVAKIPASSAARPEQIDDNPDDDSAESRLPPALRSCVATSGLCARSLYRCRPVQVYAYPGPYYWGGY